MTTPQAMVYYLDSSVTPVPGAVLTDPKTGTGLIANISPSSIQIDATVSGMQLRAHAVTAMAGASVETEIQS